MHFYIMKEYVGIKRLKTQKQIKLTTSTQQLYISYIAKHKKAIVM